MRSVARRAIALVSQPGTAPAPMLQRRLRLGYSRAGTSIEVTGRRGVISGYDGPRLRQVLIGEADAARLVSELGRASGSGG